MEKVTKENNFGIEVYDYTGEYYETAMSFESWRVAYLNHGDNLAKENFKKIERHNESDEVFVLLSGSATLIVGEELKKVKMEPHKLYNVPKGVWHGIFTEEGTSVLIIENADTGPENTEYIFIK